MKWIRLRSGHYSLATGQGGWGNIETGSDSGMWWWFVSVTGAGQRAGKCCLLRDAKARAEKFILSQAEDAP